MTFYPDANARIIAGPSPGAAEADRWLGKEGGSPDAWLRVAIENLPADPGPAAGRGRGTLAVFERGTGAGAGRAFLSGTVSALAELARTWTAAGAGWARSAAAMEQAVSNYLAALEPPRPGAPARLLVVGVLNVTPDSFSDGGQYLDPEIALRRGQELVAEGADWLDVGGESTRPGAVAVSADEEIRRVLPVVARLAESVGVPISVDTRKSQVAESCLAAGATVVNDVSALGDDPAMARVIAAAGASVVLMHMPGDPAIMQGRARYEDVVAHTTRYLRERADAAVAAGIGADRIWIDPGFGFGKTVEQNLSILRRLREYTSIGLPVLIGTSRKSTIGAILDGLPPGERVEGTAATVAAAVLNGAAAVRVHDVRAMVRVARVGEAIARCLMSAGAGPVANEEFGTN